MQRMIQGSWFMCVRRQLSSGVQSEVPKVYQLLQKNCFLTFHTYLRKRLSKSWCLCHFSLRASDLLPALSQWTWTNLGHPYPLSLEIENIRSTLTQNKQKPNICNECWRTKWCILKGEHSHHTANLSFCLECSPGPSLQLYLDNYSYLYFILPFRHFFPKLQQLRYLSILAE